MALKVSPVPLQVPTVTKKASRVALFSLLPSQKSAIAGTSSADVVAQSAGLQGKNASAPIDRQRVGRTRRADSDKSP